MGCLKFDVKMMSWCEVEKIAQKYNLITPIVANAGDGLPEESWNIRDFKNSFS